MWRDEVKIIINIPLNNTGASINAATLKGHLEQIEGLQAIPIDILASKQPVIPFRSKEDDENHPQFRPVSEV
jgi:hypothetical protein